MADLEKDTGEPRRRIGGHGGELRESERREELRDEREESSARSAARVREEELEPEEGEGTERRQE